MPFAAIAGCAENERGVVVADDEVDRLARLVWRDRRRWPWPSGDRLRAGVLVHRLVRSLGEARRVVDGGDGDRAGDSGAESGSVTGDPGDGAGGDRRILRRVVVCDGPERVSVVEECVGAGQGQCARARLERTSDVRRVHKTQDILAVLVVARDLNRGAGEVGVVQVGNRDRVIDDSGGVILGVGQCRSGCEHRRVVGRRDVDRPRDDVAEIVCGVRRRSTRTLTVRWVVLGSSLVLLYFTAAIAACYSRTVGHADHRRERQRAVDRGERGRWIFAVLTKLSTS